MSNSSAELVVQNQLEYIRHVVEQERQGEYLIPDVVMVEWDSDKIRLLNYLLFQLTRKFPEYEWRTVEALDPTVRGVKVAWRHK